MNEAANNIYEQKLNDIAQELSQQGYTVHFGPSSQQLPFQLGNYLPDLVASKGDGGIILQLKTTKGFSVDRLQEIAETIAEHKGWRFMLVTVDDISKDLLPEAHDDLPSWVELQTKVERVSSLIQPALFEPALLYLWSIIEAMLRKRAIAQCIPIERLSIIPLLKHMYSSGEISMDEFDVFNAVIKKRNRVAHGLVTSLETPELEHSLAIVRTLIKKWQHYPAR